MNINKDTQVESLVNCRSQGENPRCWVVAAGNQDKAMVEAIADEAMALAATQSLLEQWKEDTIDTTMKARFKEQTVKGSKWFKKCGD